MLAPIMTKDMKLFPTRPLPQNVKNVRSRAQSLQDFANSHGPTATSRSRVIPARQRNAHSVGNLSGAAPTSRSPPKSSSSVRNKGTLDAIAEGVEMPSTAASSTTTTARRPPSDAGSESGSTPKSTPDLQQIGRSRPSSVVSTASSPHVEKIASTAPLVDKNANMGSSGGGGGGGQKNFVKWLTSTFKSSSKGGKDGGGGGKADSASTKGKRSASLNDKDPS